MGMFASQNRDINRRGVNKLKIFLEIKDQSRPVLYGPFKFSLSAAVTPASRLKLIVKVKRIVDIEGAIFGSACVCIKD